MSRLDEPLKETPIGPMPKSWEAVPLHSLVEDTETVDFERDKNRLIRYVDVSSISRELLKISGSQPSLLADAPGRARKVMRRNDVIFATVRPTLLRVAHIPAEYDGEICSTAFCVLRDKNRKLGGKFIYYLIQRPEFLDQLARIQSGASYPAVTDRQVKSQLVPLPPDTAEQEKIAALLLKAQRAVEAEEALIRTTRELKRAVMQKLFTEGLRGEPQKETPIGLMPKSWEVCEFGTKIIKAQYGLSIKGHSAGQYPILRMNCQLDGQTIFRDLQFVDVDPSTYDSFKLNDGDLLFNRTNSYELVGRTSIFHGKREAVFASYLIRLSLDQEQLIPDFSNYYLNMDSTQAALKTLATRGVSQSNINASKLKSFLFPKPSLDEQHEFVRILQTLDAKLALHERRRALLRELFRALLHELMTGQTRVSDLAIDTAEVAVSQKLNQVTS